MTRLTVLMMVSLIVLMPLLSGCGIGYTRTIFATKTNVGLEVSTKPPTLELDISRFEGVVSPQFENGKKLPVMASFRFGNEGFFSPAVGSAFSTGDAAITMAALYGDQTPFERWDQRITEVKKEDFSGDSTLKLDHKPKVMTWLPSWLEWLRPEFQKKDVRPVFFGTDTALGIKVAWSGMTGGYPDSAVFGYNRKELALVPISMQKNDSGKYEMKQASLLATIDSGTKLSTDTEDEIGLDFQLVQYFATGDAANLMALQEDVRKSMLARLDPHGQDFKGKFGGGGQPKTKQVITRVLVAFYDGLVVFGKPPDEDKIALEHVERLDQIFPLLSIPDKYEDKGIILYSYDSKSKTLEKTTKGGQIKPKEFLGIISYWTNLEKSIEKMKLAKIDVKNDDTLTLRSDDGTTNVTGKLDPGEKQLLDSQLNLQELALKELDKNLMSNQQVIEAYMYIIAKINPA